MSYSQHKYGSRPMVLVVPAASFGTSTGAGTASNSLANPAYLPKALKRQKINKIRVRCTVAPNAAATVLSMNFMNGTNTFGAITLTTAAAQAVLDATVTASNAIIARDVQPTIGVIGTFTASGGTLGSYEVFMEVQEEFEVGQ